LDISSLFLTSRVQQAKNLLMMLHNAVIGTAVVHYVEIQRRTDFAAVSLEIFWAMGVFF